MQVGMHCVSLPAFYGSSSASRLNSRSTFLWSEIHADAQLRRLQVNVIGTEPYVGPVYEVATSSMARLYQLMENPSLSRFCENHLRLNDLHYEGYELTEKRLEDVETRSDNTDFYIAAKVDTH